MHITWNPSTSSYAASPFDHEKADIILRSSDNIDFRVFKLFLSLAFPFFEALFSIPQPAELSEDQEIKDGLAVIPVTEDSKTLDTLLRFCYPCTLAEDPKLDALADLIDVLEAARKYSFDVIERKVLQTLSNPVVLETEPLRCFAIARRGRAREETLLAAKHTLSQPLIPSHFPELDLITAADLLALLAYHKKCGDAVFALRTDTSWIQSHYRKNRGCPWLYRDSKSYSGSCSCSEIWWDGFWNGTFAALRDRPCGSTVETLAATTVKNIRARDCTTCSISISAGMQEFSQLLTRKIDEVVSKIELNLEF